MNQSPGFARLDGLFEAYDRTDAPGLVVGVAHRGEVIYRRGLGMASLELGVANTPSTRMRIGSTTKHFTCLGILLLEEAGKLDTRKSVRTWLPELDGQSGEPTLLQLMHHVGGLGDTSMAALLANGGCFGHTAPGGSMQLLRRLRRPNFAPGSRMAYSNDGYTLLSLVIERVSGQSWNAFMTDRVFAPLGLSATELLRSDLDIVPGMASLHVPKSGGGWRRGIYFSDELLGSGGMISTVDDMLAWTAHLRAADRKVGSEALWARMLQPQNFADGTSLGYGLGLIVERYRGIDVVHHAGATMGSQSQMLIAPAHELDIVVMSNRMDVPAPALALKALEAVLEHAGLEPEPEPPAAADFPALPGRWFGRRSRTLMSIEPRALKPGQREALTVSLYNASALPWVRSGSGLARHGGPYSPIEVRRLPQSKEPARQLDVHICGEPERFDRLPSTPPAAAELAPALCGRYRYVDFDKEVEIVLRGGRLILDLLPLSGMAEWELQPFADDIAGCGSLRTIPELPLPISAALTFERDHGAVSGFWLDSDRLRNARFERCRE